MLIETIQQLVHTAFNGQYRLSPTQIVFNIENDWMLKIEPVGNPDLAVDYRMSNEGGVASEMQMINAIIDLAKEDLNFDQSPVFFNLNEPSN